MLKNLLTVLYYTSSREDPKFEQKIIDNLLKQCADLPIISVSQKPLNLGRNICVGMVGFSYLNEWRQILTGAKEIKTPFIICAESDFLHHKEYFTFVPKRQGFYAYDNVWIVYKDPAIAGSYRRIHYFSDGAQICSRDLLIEKLEKFFEGKPQWFGEKEIVVSHPYLGVSYKFFTGEIPSISFKTENGRQKYTYVRNEPNTRSLRLPYWGHVAELRKKYFS